MKGYYKDEEKTREVMADGWFRSGDLGYLDENGEIRVAERKKECINTGGEKVFPMEVEEVIAKNPKVEDVCVIGVPDEEWGNTVRAVIQRPAGSSQAMGRRISPRPPRSTARRRSAVISSPSGPRTRTRSTCSSSRATMPSVSSRTSSTMSPPRRTGPRGIAVTLFTR